VVNTDALVVENLIPSFVATPKDVTDRAAVKFIYWLVVVGVALDVALESVMYLSVEPSRQGAESAHISGVPALLAKSETDVEGVGLSAAKVAPTYVQPAAVASTTTEEDVKAVNNDVDGVAAVNKRQISRM
jgi:hypothetical protein